MTEINLPGKDKDNWNIKRGINLLTRANNPAYYVHSDEAWAEHNAC